MAKNYNPNNLDQRQAEIRKAKGNPNKNIHHKKKNSNYQGYSAAQRADAAARMEDKHQKERQPAWVTIVMIIIFVVLIAVLVLMNGAMKDNAVFAQAATLTIGLSCGVLVYLQRFNKNPGSGFQKVLTIVLAVMAVVYSFMGAYGLIKLL